MRFSALLEILSKIYHATCCDERGKPRNYKTLFLWPASSLNRMKGDSSPPPAEAFAGAKAEEKNRPAPVRNDGKGELLRLLRLLGAGRLLARGLGDAYA